MMFVEDGVPSPPLVVFKTVMLVFPNLRLNLKVMLVSVNFVQ